MFRSSWLWSNLFETQKQIIQITLILTIAAFKTLTFINHSCGFQSFFSSPLAFASSLEPIVLISHSIPSERPSFVIAEQAWMFQFLSSIDSSFSWSITSGASSAPYISCLFAYTRSGTFASKSSASNEFSSSVHSPILMSSDESTTYIRPSVCS